MHYLNSSSYLISLAVWPSSLSSLFYFLCISIFLLSYSTDLPRKDSFCDYWFSSQSLADTCCFYGKLESIALLAVVREGDFCLSITA